MRSAQREFEVLKRRELTFKSGEYIEESAAKKVERPMPSFPKPNIDEGIPLKLDIKDYETTLLVESALDIEEGYETTLL